MILSAENQNPIYLGYLMNHETVVEQKTRMGQGDAVVHIQAKNLSEIEIALPLKDEQDEIAKILMEMDKDINAVNRTLNKTIYIKQGMMQELLTGKTRFPFKEDAV